jgi:hypothetical protein
MIGWLSECLACGQRIRPSVHNLTRQNRLGACRYCSGRGVQHDVAFDRMRAAGVHPVADFPGSDEPWPGECMKCGTPVQPRYSSIKAGQGGCTNCAVPGFNDAASAILYLVESEAWDAYKIGIANTVRRLDDHRRQGWTSVKYDDIACTWLVASGVSARAMERAVLKQWRAQGASSAVPQTDMVQKGASETVRRDGIDLDATIQLILGLQ